MNVPRRHTGVYMNRSCYWLTIINNVNFICFCRTILKSQFLADFNGMTRFKHSLWKCKEKVVTKNIYWQMKKRTFGQSICTENLQERSMEELFLRGGFARGWIPQMHQGMPILTHLQSFRLLVMVLFCSDRLVLNLSSNFSCHSLRTSHGFHIWKQLWNSVGCACLVWQDLVWHGTIDDALVTIHSHSCMTTLPYWFPLLKQ